ncbi:MAG: hypothetical protein WA160_08365 [Pseudobdellovibrio sp.]
MDHYLPNQHELFFGIHAMFFSTTNRRGIINDCNDTFVQIKKYSREEIIGSPHI